MLTTNRQLSIRWSNFALASQVYHQEGFPVALELLHLTLRTTSLRHNRVLQVRLTPGALPVELVTGRFETREVVKRDSLFRVLATRNREVSSMHFMHPHSPSQVRWSGRAR